jgi:prepilin-type N-terminal cleavage/methylation domain-containing protein
MRRGILFGAGAGPDSRGERSSRLASDFTPRLDDCDGFTLLEMIMVMFLLGGVLVLVVPRITVGEDLASTGRKFIGVLRALQGIAAEEKVPLDANWILPRSLPDTIKFTDISVGQTKRLSGRIDLSVSANGRIDPLTVHFGDTSNNVLAIAVEPLTGAIRTSDERIEPPRNQPIPERVKALLQTPQGPSAASLGIRF